MVSPYGDFSTYIFNTLHCTGLYFFFIIPLIYLSKTMSSRNETRRLAKLLLFFLFCLNIFAQGLGVKQDTSALSQDRYVWTSKLMYDRPVSQLFTDTDLYALAKQGWDEMKADIEPRRPGKLNPGPNSITKRREPGMMGLIAVGNTIYLSSSMKGGKFIYGFMSPNGQPGQVRRALEDCQAALQSVEDGTQDYHKNQGSCAEILALHQYYLDPAVSDAAKTTFPNGVRAAAYGDGGSNNPARCM
jgi:hypothetical protein